MTSLYEYKSFSEVREKYPDGVFFYCTTKAPRTHSEVDFKKMSDMGNKDIFLVFGKETKGLPETLLKENLNNCIRIPMKYNKRSLNLSNSVCVIAYEVLRQFDYENLKKEGEI